MAQLHRNTILSKKVSQSENPFSKGPDKATKKTSGDLHPDQSGSFSQAELTR